MGCNCRKTKKIHDLLAKDTELSSKTDLVNHLGLSWSVGKGYFARTIQGLLVFALLCVIFPIVLVYLLFTYIISGSYSLYIPNFISKRL